MPDLVRVLTEEATNQAAELFANREASMIAAVAGAVAERCGWQPGVRVSRLGAEYALTLTDPDGQPHAVMLTPNVPPDLTTENPEPEG